MEGVSCLLQTDVFIERHTASLLLLKLRGQLEVHLYTSGSVMLSIELYVYCHLNYYASRFYRALFKKDIF